MLDAARRLNFKPSAAARAVARRTTNQIGIIGKLHPVNTETYLGANSAILEANWMMSLLVYEQSNLDDLQRNAFKERLFDGLVVVDQIPDQIESELKLETNCIWVNTDRQEVFDCIMRDEFEVGRQAGQALLDAGWRELVFIYGPNREVHYSHRDRLRGIEDVAKKVGVVVHKVGCPEAGTRWRELDGYLSPYFGRGAFVFSDAYRVRAMQTVCMNRRLRPGRDVSVVCCDDISEFEMVWPELSRARFDRRQMGRLAVGMLLDRLKDGRPQHSRTIDCDWHAGETIAARDVIPTLA